MSVSTTLAWTLAAVSAVVVLLAGATAWSWTSDLRVVGPVIMGLALIASGLAAYFEWRANLRRRMIHDAESPPHSGVRR
jgi:hypothetical protein